MRGIRTIVVAVLAAGGMTAGPVQAAFEECHAESSSPAVGTVACVRIDAGSIGGTTAFSYYIPEACDGQTCPVMYLLHGFGGDYRSMLGTAASPSAWVRSLTSGPATDPRTVPDPWNLAWESKPPIDMVLIAPHGRTVPGGYGPLPDLDSFWTDWNPRYAAGGDSPRYFTPPPRFEAFLLDELIPHVESRFPVRAGRESRALAGVSLGGYGAYAIGLRHPDVFSSIGSVSGAHNFLFAPAPDPVSPEIAPASVAPPAAELPFFRLPGVTSNVPLEQIPEQARGFAVSFYALGDPAADQAYYRGAMPRDLAVNARASGAGGQSLHLRAFVNDAIPRRAEDFASPPSYFGAQAFEAIVLPMNLEMLAALEMQDVVHEWELHPGIHSGAYWDPYLRVQLERQHARLIGRDGSGFPGPPPVVFDYRSIASSFDVWGWSFEIERDAVEFLTLRDVACNKITLRGTGRVTLTVAPSCGTGFGGSATVVIDLGPSMPVDEPAGASAAPVYGNTITLALTAL